MPITKIAINTKPINFFISLSLSRYWQNLGQKLFNSMITTKSARIYVTNKRKQLVLN
ncbi:hypothetical protein FM107_12595 [Sphingobacterium sp. JB170]|nr:hypothetical protein FM107_12595 [Sphingobacterium sp. JB170]